MGNGLGIINWPAWFKSILSCFIGPFLHLLCTNNGEHDDIMSILLRTTANDDGNDYPFPILWNDDQVHTMSVQLGYAL